MQKEIENVFDISFHLGSFVWSTVAYERWFITYVRFKSLIVTYHRKCQILMTSFAWHNDIVELQEIVADSWVKFVFVGRKHLGRNLFNMSIALGFMNNFKWIDLFSVVCLKVILNIDVLAKYKLTQSQCSGNLIMIWT